MIVGGADTAIVWSPKIKSINKLYKLQVRVIEEYQAPASNLMSSPNSLH